MAIPLRQMRRADDAAPAWRTAADDARLARYRRYLDFDAGNHDVGRLGIGGVPVVANYARVFVRKGASYLFPEPVALTVEPPDDTPGGATVAARAEAALARITRDNDLPATDLATAVDAGVLGDGAFKVTWGGAEGRYKEAEGRRDGLPLLPSAFSVLPSGQVRIAPVDPQTLFVECAPDDVRCVVAVRQVCTLPRAAVAAMYGVAPATDAAAVAVVEEWTAATYRVLVGEAVLHAGPNPYGALPYVIFPNTPQPHDFWGVSDLADIMNVNRALNRRLSVLAQILELSGNPVTVLENVTGAQGVNVAPGALWELPENSRAYLLDLLAGGSVEQHLRYIEALYRIMDDLAEMPRTSFGEAGQARSGIALMTQLQPVIQKTNRKRLIWSAVIQRRSALALRLLARHDALDLGPYAPDDFTIRAVWQPVVSSQ